MELGGFFGVKFYGKTWCLKQCMDELSVDFLAKVKT